MIVSSWKPNQQIGSSPTDLDYINVRLFAHQQPEENNEP